MRTYQEFEIACINETWLAMAGNEPMITLLLYAFAIICFTLLPVVLHMVATKRPSTCLTGRGARNIIHFNIEFFRFIKVNLLVW